MSEKVSEESMWLYLAPSISLVPALLLRVGYAIDGPQTLIVLACVGISLITSAGLSFRMIARWMNRESQSEPKWQEVVTVLAQCAIADGVVLSYLL